MLKYMKYEPVFTFATKGTDWVQEKEWGKVNGERCPLFFHRVYRHKIRIFAA